MVLDTDRTINIIRAGGGKIYLGTSDGQVKIINSNNMQVLG